MRQRQDLQALKLGVVLLIYRTAIAARQTPSQDKVKDVLQPLSDYVAARGIARAYTQISKDRTSMSWPASCEEEASR